MIAIHRDTKISELIRANERSIEAIASVAKPLEKLRNPLIRKIMAARTTLADAARISGHPLCDITDALKPLGFEFIDRSQLTEESKGASFINPDFARHLDEYPQVTLDVRADLEGGADPLKKIMGVIKKLPDGQVLHLINSFEPTPLIQLLGHKGWESHMEKKDSAEVHVYFRRASVPSPEMPEEGAGVIPGLTEAADFDRRKQDFGARLIPLDVSELEMPLPMVTILQSISDLASDSALLVTHKRVPIFLFDELRQRKCGFMVRQLSEHDIRLLIWKEV
jgi:uncharacterized protein (DUF2249 family)